MKLFKRSRDNEGRYTFSTLTKIKSSWTYKHPKEIVIMSLAVVVLIQGFDIQVPSFNFAKASTIEYTAEETTNTELVPGSVGYNEHLEEAIKKRGLEIFDENIHIYLEQARMEAVDEYKIRLVGAVFDSPYVEMNHEEQRAIRIDEAIPDKYKY